MAPFWPENCPKSDKRAIFLDAAWPSHNLISSRLAGRGVMVDIIFTFVTVDLKLLIVYVFSYRFSWERIQHLCRLRRRYIHVYANILQQLPNVDNEELQHIEKDLDSKVILLWR